MRKKSLLVIFVFFVCLTMAFSLGVNPNSDDSVEARVISSGNNGFSIEITFPEPEFATVTLNNQIYNRVVLAGCGVTSEAGKPEIPTFTKLIRLPGTGGFSVKCRPVEAIIFPDMKIPPAQPLQKDGGEQEPFTINDDFYRADAVYPETLIDKGEIGIWRDLRVAPVNFYPLQYNPARKELKFYNSLIVDITYTGDGENEKTNVRNSVSEAFAPLYQALSIGPNGYELDNPVERGAYLIITAPQYYDALQDWAEWKTRMGYHTYVASTYETGSTASSITTYINNVYYDWDVPPEYVVLVADEDSGIPTHFIPGSYYPWACTDLPFTLIEGNDYFPEVLIGRLSVDNSSQLSIILHKMEHYEITPYLGATDWYTKALVIADYTGSTSCMFTKEFTEDQLEYGGYTNITNAYYPGSSTSLISSTINSGVSLVNYRGYGASTYWTMNIWNHWDRGDIQNLYNGYKLPVVTSMVCGGGNFAYYSDPCFGEAWIRYGSVSGSTKGAVAFCGPSEVDTHTKWNNNLDCGLYWGIFRQDLQHFAPALLYAEMELWLDYPHNRVGIWGPTNSVGFYFHVYNILGDPGLRMWTAQPQPITAQYENPFPYGDNQFTIALTDTGGFPLSDAYVCIWKGDEIYEGGKTDASGSITLPMNDYTAGTIKLTVTGKNLIPLIEDVDIEASDILLGIYDFTIVDDNSGSTSGNGDEMLSPAETADLHIAVKNFGSSVAGTGISGVLSAQSPKVEIIQSMGNFGNLAPGETAEAVYSVSLSSDLTSVDTLGLTLDLSCPQGNWTQTLWADISDAEFIPIEYEYSPAMLEPGGEADFIVTLSNAGLCDAVGISANLISLDPFIQIVSSAASFGNIASGAEGDNSLQPFVLSAGSMVYPGRLSHLQLNYTTSEGYTPMTDLIVQVGTVYQTDPMGPDEYGCYCFDSGDSEYGKAPVFDWMEINSIGTALYLPDYSDEDDCRVSVDLPFTFTYYGEDYNMISVCSNGFISMGYSDVVTFRNKAIPSAMGPPAMIAGFWDDLHMLYGTPDGTVYKYYDSAANRFIIEYYNVKSDYANANECFQIILYDPAHYPTPTGDGEIVIQYLDVNDIDSSDNYSTVGMEDWDHTTGLQYVFSNIYPQSSHTLSDNLAIRFTTDPGELVTISLDLTLEPVNPPIVIPAGGGSFSFQAGVTNTGNTTVVFDFWTEVDLPGGGTISPVFLRTGLSLEPGANLTRTLEQYVTSRAPAGEYTFRGIVGDNTGGSIIDSQEFNFEKVPD